MALKLRGARRIRKRPIRNPHSQGGMKLFRSITTVSHSIEQHREAGYTQNMGMARMGEEKTCGVEQEAGPLARHCGLPMLQE